MRLENKKIIVTAAAQGIGRATALKFASEGASVIATDINEQKLEEIKSLDPSIEIAKLDSTNKEEVENFYAKIDNIDVLFHAVGFVHHGALLDCDTDEFYNSVNINIFSAYLMTHTVLPKMLKKKKGNIVIISSAASSVKGVPNRFIYATTKAALNGFVKSVAADYIKDGIRCNAILPLSLIHI